jgi:pyrroline-5-carboxylate reductase
MAKVSIAVIGGGALGGALVRGLGDGSEAEIALWLVEPDADKAQLLGKAARLSSLKDVSSLPMGIDLAIVAVKPALVSTVCRALARRSPKVVLSLAAAVPLVELRRALGGKPALYRAMMSTAAAQRQTTTSLLAESTRTLQPDWLDALLRRLGGLVHLNDEKLLDAVMAVSASAPAFFLAAAEGLADGGVRLGLGRAMAETLALGAMRSAFAVAEADGMTRAKYGITSPGGTTIEGLAVLERNATKAAFSDAAVAVVHRAHEMQASILPKAPKPRSS